MSLIFNSQLQYFFYKQLWSEPSSQTFLYFQDFQGSKLLYANCRKTLVKDQSSFYEIRGLAICIDINAFKRVYRKQLNILKTLELEYKISGIL